MKRFHDVAKQRGPPGVEGGLEGLARTVWPAPTEPTYLKTGIRLRTGSSEAGDRAGSYAGDVGRALLSVFGSAILAEAVRRSHQRRQPRDAGNEQVLPTPHRDRARLRGEEVRRVALDRHLGDVALVVE